MSHTTLQETELEKLFHRVARDDVTLLPRCRYVPLRSGVLALETARRVTTARPPTRTLDAQVRRVRRTVVTVKTARAGQNQPDSPEVSNPCAV